MLYFVRARVKVWELALAAGRASDVYEIVGSADEGGSSGTGGTGAAHRAAFEINQRLKKVSSEGLGGSFAVESQAVAVRNFYIR